MHWVSKRACNHPLNMAKFTILLINTRTSTFNISLPLCSFSPCYVNQSLTLSNHVGARDNEHDWLTGWNILVTLSQANGLMYFGHRYGLACWNLWSFYNKVWRLSPFEPLVPYVPPWAKPHKKDYCIISPKFDQLVGRIHVLT
jgi:hypothetical protein